MRQRKCAILAGRLSRQSSLIRTQFSKFGLTHLLLFWVGLFGIPAAARADEPVITDRAIRESIEKAVDWLKRQQTPDGNWETDGADAETNRYHGGDTALVCLALLYAGESANETYLNNALYWLEKQKMSATYSVALRAHALSLVPGRQFRATLREDLRWLARACAPRGSNQPGAYGYVIDDAQNGWWDNSNSQYGVLGVWMATDAGVEMTGEQAYWQLVRDHWVGQQQGDGGWAYRRGDASNGSMTAAGVATLFVVLDRLQAGSAKETAGLQPAIQRGLDWLGREFTPDNPYGQSNWKYYYLYGVERAGRASGYKYFRNRDWYRVGATDLLRDQSSEGAWDRAGLTPQRNTSFALMFLCHGRAPLVFNKLDLGDESDVRARDLAGLTWHTQSVLERLFNWQIVPLDAPMADWLEAPALFIGARAMPEWTPAQTQKLQDYVNQGGLLIGTAYENSGNFVRSFQELGTRLFPGATWRKADREHPLYNGDVQYKLSEPPQTFELHNGLRPLMILVTRDVSMSWNKFRAEGKNERNFQVGVNLYLYATDKGLKTTRLESALITPKNVEIRRTIRVGRVRHSGTWDIEPWGWVRLAAEMNNETATRLLVSSGVGLDQQNLREEFDVLHVTGTQRFSLSSVEQNGLRKFLSSGGVLIADPAGGSREFLDSFEDAMREVLRTEPLLLVESTPLLTGDEFPDSTRLSTTGYRRSARGRKSIVRDAAPLRGFSIGQRLAVVYSPIDLSIGLLGTDVWDLNGFEPPTVLAIFRNLLLYGASDAMTQGRLSTPK